MFAATNDYFDYIITKTDFCTLNLSIHIRGIGSWLALLSKGFSGAVRAESNQ